LDFRTIRDLGDATKVAGASAHCTSCSRPLGRVRLREVPVPLSMPTSATTSGFFDEGTSFWFDLPFFRSTAAPAGPSSVRPGSASPPAAPSALKRGTGLPLKKSKTLERLESNAIRAQTQQSGRSSKSFWLCCAPCRQQGEKDQIVQTSMRVASGSPSDEGYRDNGSDSPSATSPLPRSGKSSSVPEDALARRSTSDPGQSSSSKKR
jgi:hypothetical protein